MNIDLSRVGEEFNKEYDALFEGFTYFKRGWYYRVTDNVIEIKLHQGKLARYIENKEKYGN